jgi:hypothetical protein
VVQAAALTVLSDMPAHVFTGLVPMHQERLAVAAVDAAGGAVLPGGSATTGVSGVRSAGPPRPAAVCVAGCRLMSNVLSAPGAMDASVLSDSALRRTLPALVAQPCTQPVRLAASLALAQACEAAALRCAAGREVPAVFREHAAGLAGAACAAAALNDVERARTNGLRAVGALAFCMPWEGSEG